MFLKIGDMRKYITYRIMILTICLIMLSLELIPICCATTGDVIVFERKNSQGIFGDVGHVGLAIQLEDGTWIAGAIEGPGDKHQGGIFTAGYNGGWYHVFKTKEDVIKEFTEKRPTDLSDTESGKIVHHEAYDKMKTITVQEIDAEHVNDAEAKMKNFEKGGFSMWTNNDCFTRAYDVMRAYGVGEDTAGKKGWMKKPKEFFDSLPGDAKPFQSDQQNTQGQSRANPWTNSKILSTLGQSGIGFPQISPSGSGIPWFSDQHNEGSGVSEPTSASEPTSSSYFDQSNDVWYIDAYGWLYIKSLYTKPAAPRHFRSGELNTYGYNWIYLPYEQTGMTHDQDYDNWVEEYLASIGSSGTSAGYGLLIDDGPNGGEGW